MFIEPQRSGTALRQERHVSLHMSLLWSEKPIQNQEL